MGAIITNYDLAGGVTRSSSITNPTGVDFQVLLGTVAGRVLYYPEKKQSTGDWVAIKNDDSEVLSFSTLNEVENEMSIRGLIGTGVTISMRIVPIGAATGTLSIDAVTDGAIV